MTSRILIMGLPGAGKTYLATELIKSLDYAGKTVTWFNADNIRARYDDWDFSAAGRIRQSHRMRELADSVLGDYVVCDFVAPLPDMRDIFAAEWTIWVDTISQGRYFDTNELFCPPDSYHFRVTEQDATKWAGVIAAHILNSGV